MEMFTETNGYKTREMAVKKMEEAIAKFKENGTHYHHIRYLIASNDRGRFIPVVMLDNRGENMWFVHANPNICVAN